MDTILNAAYGAIGGASPYVAVLLLLLLVLFMQFFIGSATAKAFLIMPLILPLVDLVGLTRQTAVQAFLFGDGFTNMMGVVVLGLALPYFSWVTVVLPQLFPRLTIAGMQLLGMKQVAGKLKLVYSQYRELQSFAQFGSDLDSDTKTRLAQGERIVKVLGQGRGKPVPMAKQVCIFYAVIHDYLMDIEVDQIPAFEEGFYDYMARTQPMQVTTMSSQGNWSARA